MAFVALAFIVATLLSACCLWAVTKWSRVAVPIVDLLIITGLCSGLALLPRAGWLLAMLIMSLLLLRATDVDLWPDAVLMLVASGMVWLLVRALLLGSM